jgi:nitroreductase
MALLDLNPDELLSTTRAVRKRLDFSRDVPDALIRECAASALQAPSGSNHITMSFVIVKDPAKRQAIADVYAKCWEIYSTSPMFAGAIEKEGEAAQAQQNRVVDSATFLSQNMAKSPVLLIACSVGARLDNLPPMASASVLGNILPATWSFMLAARARGLGTAWTTIHLMMEQAVADIVGIPFDTVQQVCLSPLAYTVGTDFKPAMRPEPDSILHWDTW